MVRSHNSGALGYLDTPQPVRSNVGLELANLPSATCSKAVKAERAPHTLANVMEIASWG